jgi:hypothetical protein
MSYNSNVQNIDDLRNIFKANESASESFPNNYYPFWKMNDGEHAVIRLLPDANTENPNAFFVEKAMHNLVINGENKNVPCMSMYGEDCPICAVSSAYYNKGDKVNGKKYWKKRQYLMQAIVIKDPLPKDETTGENFEGKVCCIAMGFQLYNIIKDASMSGELDAIPFHFKNGVDFIIKKTKQGEYSNYVLSKFMRTNRDLTDDEIAIAEAGMIDLATLIPRQPTVEAIQESLSAAMNTNSDISPTASYDDPTSSYSADTTTTDTTVSGDDDGEGSDEADAILAEILNRKRNGSE